MRSLHYHHSDGSVTSFAPHLASLPPAQRSLWPLLAPTVDLCLVLHGGTAIALRYGNRESIDFDFFGSRPLNKVAMTLRPPARHEMLMGFGVCSSERSPRHRGRVEAARTAGQGASSPGHLDSEDRIAAVNTRVPATSGGLVLRVHVSPWT